MQINIELTIMTYEETNTDGNQTITCYHARWHEYHTVSRISASDAAGKLKDEIQQSFV